MSVRFVVSFLTAVLSIATEVQARISCSDVYSAAVRNISLDVQRSVYLKDAFSRHCSNTGKVRDSSINADMTIPIKEIVLGFSGSASDARQEMEEFCKDHSESITNIGARYIYENEVAVDALKSFNDCKALEINETFISHSVIEPTAVMISVDFNPSKTNVELRGITYDPKSASCTSSVGSKDGAPTQITSASALVKADRPFLITCERKGEQTSEGAMKFPRFAVGIDTNHGPYTVVMPLEELAGFDLASRYQNNLRDVEAQRNSYLGEMNALKERIDSFKAKPKIRLVRFGEYPLANWEHVTCPQLGGNFDAHVNQQCSGLKPLVVQVMPGHGGNRCGYAYYAYTCVPF